MYLKNLETLKNHLLELQSNDKIKSCLLFGCDKEKPSTNELNLVLSLNNKPLIGGIFPEIIAEGQRKETGFVLLALEEELEVIFFETQENNKISEQLLNKILQPTKEIESVFCFFNAFWTEKKAFMQGLFDELGPFVNYLGGGAGSLNFESFPCIFANKKTIEQGSVIGLMKTPFCIGVAHGWQPISEPIKVTETKGNIIKTLNWKPAFDVYKSYIEMHSNLILEQEHFFDIAKSYPLGLVKLDDEMIIRDPYATENGALFIVDEVPEGEYIRIMHGHLNSLLDGANHAVRHSEKENYKTFNQLCIDCISRVLFMQDDFKKELEFLNKNQKANGVLSIGEIANPNNSALELFNKTVVIAQWKTN